MARYEGNRTRQHIEGWVNSQYSKDIDYRTGSGKSWYIHRIYVRNSANGRMENTVEWYFQTDNEWLRCWLKNPNDYEMNTLRAQLSQPGEAHNTSKGYSFRVANDSDLEVVKRIVLDRMT